MRKNVIALSIAALIGGLGLAGGASANALSDDGAGDGSGTAGQSSATTNATAIAVNNGGIGHSLLIPYYTVQNGNATLINIVNTDEVRGKAVKVRFRGASNSDDVFDFQVYLSPGDVWTANISQAADGRAQLTTTDKSCTLPASVNQSFITDRLPSGFSAADKAQQTREGYIEIFTMADIPPRAMNAAGVYQTTANPLFTAIKHVSGVAPCTASVLGTLTQNPTTIAEARTLGLQSPSTGLFGNFTIINVPGSATWTGEATSMLANVGGVAAFGNIVFFPQTGTAAPTPDSFTADPSLRTTAGAGATQVQNGAGAATPVTTPVLTALMFDLPDMSTPYLVGVIDATAPITQAAALTASLAVKSIKNEFLTDTTIAAKTDWVFSMPTRRYSVALDYRTATFVRVFTDLGATDYFTSANTSVKNSQICVTADGMKFYDREETTATAGFVISPGLATTLEFCGEASVLSFNAGGATAASVLGASVARKDVDAGYRDGWTTVTTNGIAAGGLPILGKAFVKATNPAVSPGVSGNFGASWEHRFTR